MVGLLKRISLLLTLLNIFSHSTHCSSQDNRSLGQALHDHQRGTSGTLSFAISNHKSNGASLVNATQQHTHIAGNPSWSLSVNTSSQTAQLYYSNSVLNNLMSMYSNEIAAAVKKQEAVTKELSYKGLKRNSEFSKEQLSKINDEIQVALFRLGKVYSQIQEITQPLRDHGAGETDIQKIIPSDLKNLYRTQKEILEKLQIQHLIYQKLLEHNKQEEILREERLSVVRDTYLKSIADQSIEKLVAINIPTLQEKISFHTSALETHNAKMASNNPGNITTLQNTIKAYEDALSENEVCLAAAQKIVNIHCEKYTQDLQHIMELYLQGSHDKTLNMQNQKLISSMQQAISEKCDMRHSFHHLLSEPVKKLLAEMHIPQEIFSPFRCNSFQRELAEQTHAILNNSGELFAQYHNDPNIRAYIEATAHMCVTTLDSIRFGTPQEALAKYELSSALRETVEIAAGTVTGLAKTGMVIGALYVPLLRVIVIAQGVVDLLFVDSATGPKIVKDFQNATPGQKAELAAGIFGGLFGANSSFPPEANMRSEQAATSLSQTIYKETQWLKNSQKAEQLLIKTPEGLVIPNKAPILTALKEISSTKPPKLGAGSVTGSVSKTAGSTSNAGAGTKLTEFEIKAASEASTIGKATLLAQETISLHQLDASVGNIKKLEEAIKMFKDIPGAAGRDGPITKLLETGKTGGSSGALGTARGAAAELEIAYDITKQGQTVIGFGPKYPLKDAATGKVIKILDADIETTSSIIECKNRNWNSISADEINSLKGDFSELNRLALSHNKTLKIFSKHPFPEIISKWLKEKNIYFIER